MAFSSAPFPPLTPCRPPSSSKGMKRSNIFFFYALLLFILERNSPYISFWKMLKNEETFLSALNFLVILFSFLRSVKLFPFLISIYASIFLFLFTNTYTHTRLEMEDLVCLPFVVICVFVYAVRVSIYIIIVAICLSWCFFSSSLNCPHI